MTLRHLLEDLDVVAVSGDLEVEITGVCPDSRRVRPGDLFFGLSGLKQDGQAFVRQALTAGASAAVVGRGIHYPGATLVQVDEPRKALAQASARFFGSPSLRLTVVGITGTNGKTTTAWLMQSVFLAAGRRAGVIGTAGIRLDGEMRPTTLTTPGAPELAALLREMVDRGLDAVALEVSSHALVQRRCFDLAVDVAVFTNLSHDHLDYHGTLDAYLDAKLMLFDGRNRARPLKPAVAVINADDPASAAVRAAAGRGGMRVRSYGESAGADARIARVAPGPRGLDVELVEAGRSHALAIPMWGRYNAWNAAAAFTAARALGLSAETAARGIAAAPGVPGRLERIDRGQDFTVVVDYAHTPDALARALAAAREHAPARVLVVFGCGGDRDRAKRPVMGRVAADLADLAWVTSDNPRGEDPRAIAEEILAGAPGAGLRLELDRRAAIAAALLEARSGDAVVIAGKGHETTQTVGERVLPFDDREVAGALLAGAQERRT